jgi:NAD(P) transhydrogenase subunit alpha
MRIGSPKEVMPGEARVAMTPDSATQLQKLGYECFIESGAGQLARFSDADYEAAGVTVVDSAAALFDAVDVIAKVRPPVEDEVKRLKKVRHSLDFSTQPAMTRF